MALPARSALRSLVLPISPGKPRMSSFSSSSSSSCTAATVTPGNCTLAAPTDQPPAAPALPDCWSHKCPPHKDLVLHPVPDPPKKGNTVFDESSLSTMEHQERIVPLLHTVDEDPKHPALSDCCSSHKCPGHEEFVPPLPGDPCGTAENVADKPLLYAIDEDPKYPTPDDGSCWIIRDPNLKLSEDVKHSLPDPPHRP